MKIHCWVLGKSPEAVGSHKTVFVYMYHVHILPYYACKSYYPKRIHNAVLLHIFCFHLKLKNMRGRGTGKSSLGYFQPRKQAAAGSFAKQAVPVKFLPTADSVGSLSFEYASQLLSCFYLERCCTSEFANLCETHKLCIFIFHVKIFALFKSRHTYQQNTPASLLGCLITHQRHSMLEGKDATN